ncbi:Oidioi.mRNA.OKI2018_I69.chr2.g3980.t1.cds [Oikopleura dioica]|uniref:Oidioi.mRNA.OKI2018_I69.chr2.g3980.t1.cds n=1 Tax=Oikopleura dioica TaxID=34765 RepID=A0ABN7SVJ3_OIKDI|nr:Oidioi.mRNA.OKI2018_I69.chr2.g3980.t1.cds [Oikopleura dioica]
MSVVRKNEKAKRFKRITLASLVIFGLLGSSIAFYQCVREYLSFEIHTEQKFVEVREQPFPTVTLCLNSMHSKEKIREYYPELEYILDLLYFNQQMNEETLQEIKSGHLAGNSDWRNYDEVIIVEELLRSTTMWEFVNKTSSHFMVSACRAGSVDCSERTGVWKDDFFEQGRCKTFSGSSARYLDLIMIYNRTDWTVGWSSFYDGITLYYSENTYKNDAISKPMIFNRMITNPTNAAVVGLSKTKNAKLGKPYSQCVKNGTLKYSSAEYTMDSCLHECKGNKNYLVHN